MDEAPLSRLFDALEFLSPIDLGLRALPPDLIRDLCSPASVPFEALQLEHPVVLHDAAVHPDRPLAALTGLDVPTVESLCYMCVPDERRGLLVRDDGTLPEGDVRLLKEDAEVPDGHSVAVSGEALSALLAREVPSELGTALRNAGADSAWLVQHVVPIPNRELLSEAARISVAAVHAKQSELRRFRELNAPPMVLRAGIGNLDRAVSEMQLAIAETWRRTLPPPLREPPDRTTRTSLLEVAHPTVELAYEAPNVVLRRPNAWEVRVPLASIDDAALDGCVGGVSLWLWPALSRPPQPPNATGPMDARDALDVYRRILSVIH